MFPRMSADVRRLVCHLLVLAFSHLTRRIDTNSNCFGLEPRGRSARHFGRHQWSKLWIVEYGSHAMANIESGLVCRLASVLCEHPLNLHCAHTLLALADQVDHFKPDGQRIVRVLEYRADQRREAIALLLADFHFAGLLIDCLSAALTNPIPRAMLDFEYLVRSASRAADAIGPTESDQQRHAFVLGIELLVNLLKTNHKRTLHRMTDWCQVRQMSMFFLSLWGFLAFVFVFWRAHIPLNIVRL
jgi:hypothetical protein